MFVSDLFLFKLGNNSLDWSVCVPNSSPEQYNNEHVECVTGGSNRTGESEVKVRFGRAQRHLQDKMYHYTPDPNVTHAAPSKSFLR